MNKYYSKPSMNMSGLGLILVLLSYLLAFPNTSFAENSGNDNLVSIKLTENISFDIMDKTVISLKENSEIYGELVENGDIEIQFLSERVIIPQHKFMIHETSSENEFNSYDEVNYTNSKKIIEDTIIYNNKGQEVGKLQKGVNLNTQIIDDKNFILIGNSQFYFKEESLEESTDKNKEAIEEVDSQRKNGEEGKDESKKINNNDNKEENAQHLKQKTVNSDIFKDYFNVSQSNVTVYRSLNGNLTPIGQLKQEQTYQILSDYGDWHEIQYGNQSAYVWKNATKPTRTAPNKKTTLEGQLDAEIISDVTVYDNTGGNLTPIGQIKKGSEAAYIRKMGNWYEINFGGRIGYIYENGVKEKFTSSIKYFNVTQSNVTVYKSLNGNLTPIGQLKQDQTYQIQSDYGGWHKVQYGNQSAYVWKDATKPTRTAPNKKTTSEGQLDAEINSDVTVYDNTSGSLTPIGRIKKGSEAAYIRKMGSWYEINFGGRIGYIYENGVKEKFTSSSKYFKVSQSNVTVYKSLNGNLTPIGQLKQHQTYQIQSDYGGWHKFQYGNQSAYVWKDATKPTTTAPNKKTTSEGQLDAKIISDVTVYDNTGGDLTPIGQIKKGSEATYIRKMGSWYEINFGGRIGYIYENGVKEKFTSSTKYFKVNQNNVTIYKRIDGELIPIGKLNKGQIFERYEDYWNWHKIKMGSDYGYILKEATSPASGNGIKNIQKDESTKLVFTTKSDVTVYDNSSGELSPMGVINKGIKIELVNVSGQWTEINYSGRTGYIYKPATHIKIGSIVNPKSIYTYEQMKKNLNLLANVYPDFIKLTTIGKSVDGRNIYGIRLGTGKKEIFMNGSHHAREWMTTNLLMEMIDEYSQAYAKNQIYERYNARKILDDVSIWFVPMVNPDGVSLVQKGASSAKNPSKVIKLNGGSTNFKAWKANVHGVDLNRQYPAGWETIKNARSNPGPSHYKGTKPLSEPETKAIYDFTLAHDFKTAVAYHSSGEVLYWDYKLGGSLKALTRNIADKISAKTGYSLVFPGPNPSGGGYTDWFLQSVKQPGFTPEISPYVKEQPVPLQNYDLIWKQNNTIGLMLAQEASTR